LTRQLHSAEARVANSKQIAAVLGPTMAAMLVAEFPLVQPHLYDAQIPPVVYLSGVLMFVAGLAIVRAHNLWVKNWTVLVTLSGWFFLLLGVIRMFAASQYSQAAASTSSWVIILIEGCFLAVALFITFRAYGRGNT
jgi:uncharacterized membrane protein HdeD (DUF308 family)